MTTRLERFRGHRDEYFGADEHSPLSHGQRHGFTGLSYYPERPDLRFEVALNRPAERAPAVELATSTGETQPFNPAGTVDVTVDGQPITLTVYRQPDRGRYFLPFRDATSGSETYGVGRYLDPQEQPDGTIVVDFNYAYNPYCAYGDDWSCPIPPAENIVAIPIHAGEKLLPPSQPNDASPEHEHHH